MNSTTIVQDNDGRAYLSSLDGVRMDVVNPANMQSILNDTLHAFVPAINIPGYNIEKIDTSLSANLTFPDSDYVGNDSLTVSAPHYKLCNSSSV